MRTIRILLAVTTAVAIGACSGPERSTVPDQPAVADPGFGHVHGLDLNPADGLIYAATHTGVFRLGSDGPRRIADRYQDTMGFVIAGPDRFLASGHPDLREPGPPHLGLILSTDRAQTWTPVALHGEADFHSLTVSGATVYGFDSTDGIVLRSDDHGEHWQPGADLAAVDLAVDPSNPLRVLATTAEGELLESTDAGMDFIVSSVQPPSPLVLIDHAEAAGRPGEPLLVGVDERGGVWAWEGPGWSLAGALPGGPQAFTALGADHYVAATEQGVHDSRDGGRTWSTIAAAQS